MKRLMIMILLVAAVFMMVASDAQALSVTTRWYSGYQSGGGGEFTLTPSTDLKWVLGNYDAKAKITNIYGTGFETFCLEATEGITYGATYNVVINDKAIYGGTNSINGDLISQGTAWLYDQFSLGVLTGYDYIPGAGRATSANLLQKTIWWLEDEVDRYGNPINPGVDNIFKQMVLSKFGSYAKSDNKGSFSVGVLNLYDSAGGYHQDQLVKTPEPATLMLLGLGLFVVGLSVWKLKK